ncbi:MAG: hypothetical protein M3Z25_08895 [Actinomycetota bacterium]|nr:hypothetical protein [Actinomycetota bacterium]
MSGADRAALAPTRGFGTQILGARTLGARDNARSPVFVSSHRRRRADGRAELNTMVV